MATCTAFASTVFKMRKCQLTFNEFLIFHFNWYSFYRHDLNDYKLIEFIWLPVLISPAIAILRLNRRRYYVRRPCPNNSTPAFNQHFYRPNCLEWGFHWILRDRTDVTIDRSITTYICSAWSKWRSTGFIHCLEQNMTFAKINGIRTRVRIVCWAKIVMRIKLKKKQNN